MALQPFVWLSLVNGAHNDAVIAAALLAAMLAFRDDRMGASSVLIAVAALVKLSALFMVVPLVLHLVARSRWRDAGLLALGPLGAVLMGAAIAPGSVVNAARATRGMVTRTSIWVPVKVAGLAVPHITALAIGGVAVAVAVLGWRRRGDRDAAVAAGASLSLFGLGASYTLPWYLVWGLPILALSGDATTTAIVATRGSAMLASYQIGVGSLFQTVPRFALSTALPAILIVAFVWAVWRGPQPNAPSGSVSKPSGSNVTV